MSLADALATASRTSARPCKIRTILEGLDDGDRKALQKALDDPGIPHSVIRRALIAESHSIGDNTIGHHRHGGCSCDAV